MEINEDGMVRGRKHTHLIMMIMMIDREKME